MYFMIYTTPYYCLFYAILFRKVNIIQFVLCGLYTRESEDRGIVRIVICWRKSKHSVINLS